MTTDLLLVLIYVDDIIITGNDSRAVTRLIQELGREFSLKDLGPLHYFLGVECHRTPSGLFLSQQKYIRDLLFRLKMDGVKPVSSPMATSCQLSNIVGKSLSDPFVYRSTIGALQYLSFTRPDIAFLVKKVAQFMQASTDEHWSAVKWILHYLKSTIQYGLFLSHHSSVQLTAYNNADLGRVDR